MSIIFKDTKRLSAVLSIANVYQCQCFVNLTVHFIRVRTGSEIFYGSLKNDSAERAESLLFPVILLQLVL